MPPAPLSNRNSKHTLEAARREALCPLLGPLLLSALATHAITAYAAYSSVSASNGLPSTRGRPSGSRLGRQQPCCFIITLAPCLSTLVKCASVRMRSFWISGPATSRPETHSHCARSTEEPSRQLHGKYPRDSRPSWPLPLRQQ